MKILVAEDEPTIAWTYQLVLEDKNHAVLLTFDGESCIRSYRNAFSSAQQNGKAPFDLVILDYMMPRKDGLQVMKEILSLCPDQRIVIASAFPTDNLLASLETVGNIEVLQKPFALEELVKIAGRSRHDPTVADYPTAPEQLQEARKS